MGKSFAIFSVFLLSAVLSIAQIYTTINSVQYKKLRVFSDDFVDNRYDWLINKESQLNKIEHGCLFYANPFDYNYFDAKPIMLDISRNFEIEAEIKFISGDVTLFNGLFWGDLIFGDKLIFGFSSTGDFAIWQNSDLDSTLIVKKHVDSVVNRTDFNHLKVVKLDGRYMFFINGKQVYQMTFEPFTGRYFGFVIAPKSYVQIAYFKIWYLE